jgi:DNA-binding transcriptional LysR family regulator
MELRHLSYFRAVAEELNFSRAAERLNISQPPLSRQIGELEDEFGVSLFRRGPHGVTLTIEGMYLLEETRRILGRVDSLKERIGNVEIGSARLIRIGFVASAMYSFLPELVAKFNATFPDLSFEFLELATGEQGKALISGKIDIGFVRSWLVEDGLRFVPIAEESLSVIYARSLCASSAPSSLLDFRDLPFVAFSGSCAPGMAEYANLVCARDGFAPKIVYSAGQFDSVLQLVSAGLGWAIIPTVALARPKPALESMPVESLADKIKIGFAIREDDPDRIIAELEIITRDFFGIGEA